MSRPGLVALAMISLFVTQPALANFRSISHGLEQRFGFRRTWIPFLGMARVAVRSIHPRGVRDFQLAVYQHAPKTDPLEIEKMIGSRIEKGFQPLVRIRSARSNEWAFVYARPTKDERVMEMIVLAHDDSETVLVRLTADTDKVMRELGDSGKIRRMAQR